MAQIFPSSSKSSSVSLVEIACLGDRDVAKLDVQRVRFGVIAGDSWLEPSVEEGVVHGFAVGQEHHSQDTSFRFRYGCPTTNSAVGLYVFAKRRSDGALIHSRLIAARSGLLDIALK